MHKRIYNANNQYIESKISDLQGEGVRVKMDNSFY